MPDSRSSALAPLSSHTTARPDGPGTSIGSQTNNGPQTVREPARQDLSTLRTEPQHPGVDHQSDGSRAADWPRKAHRTRVRFDEPHDPKVPIGVRTSRPDLPISRPRRSVPGIGRAAAVRSGHDVRVQDRSGSGRPQRACRAGAGSVAVDPSDLSGGTARGDRTTESVHPLCRHAPGPFGSALISARAPLVDRDSRDGRLLSSALWGMSHGVTPSRLYTVAGTSQELP
jgi:hypothetical protein